MLISCLSCINRAVSRRAAPGQRHRGKYWKYFFLFFFFPSPFNENSWLSRPPLPSLLALRRVLRGLEWSLGFPAAGCPPRDAEPAWPHGSLLPWLCRQGAAGPLPGRGASSALAGHVLGCPAALQNVSIPANIPARVPALHRSPTTWSLHPRAASQPCIPALLPLATTQPCIPTLHPSAASQA